MDDEPAKSLAQIQVEPIRNGINGAASPDMSHWTRHLEVKVVAGAIVALIVNGLRAALSLELTAWVRPRYVAEFELADSRSDLPTPAVPCSNFGNLPSQPDISRS